MSDGTVITRAGSACPLDCPDACSLEVEVADGRIVGIDGDRLNPLTAGYICGKVRSSFLERLYGPDRLLRPAVRKGKKGEADFQPVPWDEVMSRIARRLLDVRRQHGGEAILPVSYGGSNGLLSQDNNDARLFRRLGASRLARSVCAAPSGRAAEGLYGTMPGVALADYLHARLVIIWGANPSVTGIHLMPILRQAKRRGAFLAVIDPRRTQVARWADLHLPVRPGTDLALALCLIHWLFERGAADTDFLARHTRGSEELRRRAAPWTITRAAKICGIAPEAIECLARRYAEASPAVIRCGWGMERNRNGGSAVAAVLALPAVAGKFGVRGGGYTMSNSSAWRLVADAAACEPEASTRVVNMNLLGKTLLHLDDPPINALFVYNCNPLAILPNQEKVRAGLQREDLFTVVFDQVLTDTARYADVLLPATTFFERAELSHGYGAYVFHRTEAVIPPVGECRSNHDVFAELCRRANIDKAGDPEKATDLAAKILHSGDSDGGFAETLSNGRHAFPDFGDTPVQFVDVHPRTRDGKVDLVPAHLDREAREGPTGLSSAPAPRGLYDFRPQPDNRSYPLTLISPASKRTINSTLGEVRRRQVAIELHPDDARARGIESGDTVRAFNRLGEVHCLATISQEIRAGVAYLPKGLWSHNTLNGNTGNALVPDTLTDLGEGACFNDARVEVERLASGTGLSAQQIGADDEKASGQQQGYRCQLE